MDEGDRTPAPRSDRERRLAERLRENLMRRKQQGRGRRAGGGDTRSGLPVVENPPESAPEWDRDDAER